MACINMYNPDHGAHSHYHHQSTSNAVGGGGNGPNGFMSPRISFSSDFVLDSSGGPCIKHEGRRPRSAADAADPDFEFSASPSVAAEPMIAADELFFKGRLLPYREQQRPQRSRPTTIREELLAGPEEDAPVAMPARKSSGGLRWKGLLGLRKPLQQRQQQVGGTTAAHFVPGRRATDGPPEINFSQDLMSTDEVGEES